MEFNKVCDFLNIRFDSDYNLLHAACTGCWIEVLRGVKTFIGKPIPKLLAARNKEGLQCTHIIAMAINPDGQEAMEIILSLGADINEQDFNYGCTPLHLSVGRSNYDLVEWLCKVRGINLEIENWKGHTAYQMADENGDDRMMEILRQAGARCIPFVESEDEYDFTGDESGYESNV